MYRSIILCLLALGSAALAQSQDLEAQLKVCASCHGPGGISTLTQSAGESMIAGSRPTSSPSA